MKVNFRLDDLFNTEAVVALPGSEEITVRILTSSEVRLRELAAIGASSDMDKKLQDKDGAEYKATILPVDTLEAPELLAVVTAIAAVGFRKEAERDIKYKYIPFPDEATEQEKIETVQAREVSEAETVEKREKYVKDKVDELTAALTNASVDDLRRRASDAFRQIEIIRVSNEEWANQTVQMSTRRSNGRPRFTIEQVRAHGKSDGLSDQVYRALLETYGELDNADPWELEKKH